MGTFHRQVRGAEAGSVIDPSALTVKELASVLSKASGKRATQVQIRKDLKAGAPKNKDGTIHLVHYTAWLAGQVTTK